eukprot:6458427-Amphidinium_carterae.1
MHLEKWAHGVDRKLAGKTAVDSANAHGRGVNAEEASAVVTDDDIPPTIDYEDVQTCSVAHRVAELERAIASRRDVEYSDQPAPSRIELLETRLNTLCAEVEAGGPPGGGTGISEQTLRIINQLDAFAVAASQQLQKLRVFPIGVPLEPDLANDKEAEEHLGWRLHMLEKTMHEHIEIVQSLQAKMLSEVKAEQTRGLRLQTELDNLKNH